MMGFTAATVLSELKLVFFVPKRRRSQKKEKKYLTVLNKYIIHFKVDALVNRAENPT